MKFCAAALAVAMVTSAHAYFLTGSDLLLKFEKNDPTGEAYVAGVFDAYEGAVHCTPETVTLERIVDMTKTYLRSDSTDTSKPADELIGRMLGTIWPCSEKSKRGALRPT